LLPAFVLIAVATLQQLATRYWNLCPWRGGGFAMFSSNDSPPHRTVLATIRTDRGSHQVVLERFPMFSDGISKAKILPRPSRLEALADRVKAQPWALAPGEPERRLVPMMQAAPPPPDRQLVPVKVQEVEIRVAGLTFTRQEDRILVTRRILATERR
jgi:hypothetical protein